MDVFAPLRKHGDAVMSIQNRPIRSNLQRTGLTGSKRRFQLAGREAAKLLKLNRIQSAFDMQESEVR